MNKLYFIATHIVIIAAAMEITVLRTFEHWDGVHYCSTLTPEKAKYVNTSMHYRCYTAFAFSGPIDETPYALAQSIQSSDIDVRIDEGSGKKYVLTIANKRFKMAEKIMNLAMKNPDIFFSVNRSFIPDSCYSRWIYKNKNNVVVVAGLSEYFCSTLEYRFPNKQSSK